MDKDTKVLLMAVVIILVALVSFNLSDLTGKVTSEASVTVSPSSVSFGKYEPAKMVTVKVDLGDTAVDRKMYLYTCDPRKTEKRLSTYSIDLCRTGTCSGSSTHKFSVSRNLGAGMYCFKTSGEVVKSNRFEVKHI